MSELDATGIRRATWSAAGFASVGKKLMAVELCLCQVFTIPRCLPNAHEEREMKTRPKPELNEVDWSSPVRVLCHLWTVVAV